MVTERLGLAAAVVRQPDVIEDRRTGLLPGCEVAVVHERILEIGEEALNRRV
jgi:hypothetical protein